MVLPAFEEIYGEPKTTAALPSFEEAYDAPQARSLIGRIKKSVWNELVRTIPTDEPEMEVLGATIYQAQQEKIKKRAAAGIKLNLPTDFLEDEYEYIGRQLLEQPQAREDKDLKKYRQFRPTGKSALDQKLMADIAPPQNYREYLADIGIGLGSFIARLKVAGLIAPTAPPAIRWEMVNLAEGGKPGAGATMYGLLGMTGAAGRKLAGKIVGKTVLAKIERYAVRNIPTSAAFGGMEAAAGGTPAQIATQALIPPILEAPGLVRELRARPKAVTPMKPAIEKPPTVIPPEGISPAVERPGVPEAPSEPGVARLKMKVPIRGLKLYQDVFNRFAAIEEITQRAKARGMKVQAGENAGKRARGYLGIAGKAQSVLEDKTFRIMPEGKIEITGEGLKPILNDYETQLGKQEGVLKTDLQRYLKSQRIIEDLQRPSYEGAKRKIVTPEQIEKAQNTLVSLNSKYGENVKILQNTAKRLYAYQSRVLHLLVDSGHLTEEKYQQILNLNQNYVPFDRIMDEIEPSGVVPVTKRRFTDVFSPIKKIKGSEREIHNVIESIIKNTYRILDVSERNTVARNVARLGEVLPEEITPVKIKMAPVAKTKEGMIFRPSQFKPKGNIIEYFENSKRKYIEVSPELYQAMSGMNEVSSSLFINMLSKPAHWLRVGATITPEFIARNPTRDQWSAFMQTNVGFIPFVDSGRAIADITGKSDLYYDYLRSGAAQAGFVEMTRPALQKAVKELNKHPDLIKRLNILTDVQDLSQLMERATRVGVYKAGIRKGLTPVEAGFISRESTIDFARRGAKTRDVNKVIAFFNAGLQGLDKTGRTAIRQPFATTIKGMIAITIPSLLLYLRNRNDPEYKEIPRWQKDLFWITRFGDTYIRIPKPFLWGQIFGSVPERFFEYLDTQDRNAFDKLWKSIYESISPVSGDPAGGFLVTAIKPIVENSVNWNFFMSRPIVPEGREKLLPAEQYGRYTSETAKIIGETLDYSPAKIENLARGWFGGTAQYTLEASDYLLNQIQKEAGIKIQEKPRELERLPLVRGFTVEPPAESGQAESIQKFYDNAKKIESLHLTANKLSGEKAKKLRRENPEIKYYGLINRTRNDLTQLNKSIENVLGNMNLTANEKEEKINQLNKKRVKLTQKVNQVISK